MKFFARKEENRCEEREGKTNRKVDQNNNFYDKRMYGIRGTVENNFEVWEKF